MFLNVTLTPPPPSSGEGSCTTPKTPEILNSLINLTSPPLPQSYPLYQSQQAQLGQGDLLSPVSDATTPGEEVAAAPLDGTTTPAGTPGDARQRGGLVGVDLAWSRCLVGGDRGVEGGGGGGGGEGGGGGGGGMCRGGLVGGSPGTSGLRGPLMGSSPPATPDLPSPVTTVQATKTALIKEGLKHQIRTKLQAAGVGPEFILSDSKLVKEEQSDDDSLTMEDEERRRRRRERNKIAATKCRNKKKEKTQILMSESESVEDQNARLKSELQRLTNEKSNLEKLLRDPNHRASCRHTHARKTAHSRPTPTPQVVVTPADNSPTTETPTSSSALHQQPPTSSLITSPTLSSPPLGSPPLSSPTSSTCSSSSCSSSPTTPPSSQVTSPTSSTQFLAHKFTHNVSRHHPYQHPLHRPAPPPLQPIPQPQAPSIPASHAQPTLPQSSAYVDHPSRTPTSSATSASSPTTPDFPQSSASTVTPRPPYNSPYHNPSMTKPQEFLHPPTPKSSFSPGPSKIRNNSLARFVPYSRSGRPPSVPSPLTTHAHPQPMLSVAASAEGMENFNQGGGNTIVCRREDQYLSDPRQNQFFPPCTFGGM